MTAPTLNGNGPQSRRAAAGAAAGSAEPQHRARTHPGLDITNLHTGSGVLTYLATCRRHSVTGSDGVREAAQLIYRGIMKSSRWPGGVDKIVTARRVRKSLLQAAAAEEEAAKAFAATRTLWLQAIGDPSSMQIRTQGIDPTK